MPRAPKPHVEPNACFLNIPYDDKFENLDLSIQSEVAGVT